MQVNFPTLKTLQLHQPFLAWMVSWEVYQVDENYVGISEIKKPKKRTHSRFGKLINNW